MILGGKRSERISGWGLQALRAEIPLLAIVTVGLALCLRAADAPIELTLPQFRALVRDQLPREKPEGHRERADAVFLQLLVAQGREAAARQSLDRLSGWQEAAQVRLQAQNAAPLDVELLRFSQARAAADLAQFEAERRRALQLANTLLRRTSDAPLWALPQALPVTASDEIKEEANALPRSGKQSAAPPPQEGRAEFADLKAQFEKELLPLGHDLLAKMYQSYLFGGTPLSALLRQEREVYQTELQYRLLLVEAEKRLSSAESRP